jgi:hypothetical protein
MIEITGLEELQKKLKDLSDRAQELDGEHKVSLSEVLTNSFISKHTAFQSAEAMLEAAGFKVESQEDFEAIPQDKMDAYIRTISKFQNWQEMLGEAAQEWAARRLGF